MQIRELEHELGVELVTRCHGVTALTEAGVEVARRAGSILGATNDLVGCVKNGPLLTGTLRSGLFQRWPLTFSRCSCRNCTAATPTASRFARDSNEDARE